MALMRLLQLAHPYKVYFAPQHCEQNDPLSLGLFSQSIVLIANSNRRGNLQWNSGKIAMYLSRLVFVFEER